ncbi:MAG: signal peptidase I [bacterium]|nr:signal peptidase I [bacterium]
MADSTQTEPPEASDASGEPGEASPQTPNAMTAIVDQVVTLVIAISIALAIRHFLVEPFRIPSGSMFPTLLIGDHLFVNKLSYGPRIPFTDLRLPGWRTPERGDVVVFEVGRPMTERGSRNIMPVDLAPDGTPTEDFVKRLVGLPGDKISWRRGQLFVNGVPADMSPAAEEFVDDRGQHYAKAWEDLGDCRHAVLDDPRPRDPRFDRGTYIVEPGRYFMMGDNRDNSNDSRGWGTVRLEEMKGPAVILYWSWDVEGNMLTFFDPRNWWRAEKRWDRIFRRVKCEPIEASIVGGHPPLREGDPAG